MVKKYIKAHPGGKKMVGVYQDTYRRFSITFDQVRHKESCLFLPSIDCQLSQIKSIEKVFERYFSFDNLSEF